MPRAPRPRPPRREARIRCLLWEDPTWRRLSDAAKTTYLQIATSPELSTCGDSALSLTRLAASRISASDEALVAAKAKEIGDDLAELMDKEFVYVDYATEEVLIRGFVTRHSLGHTWQQLMRIDRDWQPIRSHVIRSLVLDDVRMSIPSPLPPEWIPKLEPAFASAIVQPSRIMSKEAV